LLQCIFIDGSPPSAFATSSRVIFSACSSVFPLAISVSIDVVAIADTHPNVLNLIFVILLFLTFMYTHITSPHTGFPTFPMPSASFISPTFLGFLKWSITVFEYIFLPHNIFFTSFVSGDIFRSFSIIPGSTFSVLFISSSVVNLLSVSLRLPCACSGFNPIAISTWLGSNDFDEHADPVELHILSASRYAPIASPST